MELIKRGLAGVLPRDQILDVIFTLRDENNEASLCSTRRGGGLRGAAGTLRRGPQLLCCSAAAPKHFVCRQLNNEVNNEMDF